MNSPAGEPQGPKRTPLPNPLPVRRGEGEATPCSLSGLIQRQCTPALSPSDGAREKPRRPSWHSLINGSAPSDGEWVPFRAGEGSSAGPPSFHGSGCLRLGLEFVPSSANFVLVRVGDGNLGHPTRNGFLGAILRGRSACSPSAGRAGTHQFSF